MMKLYQEHKVNPMASCLPLVAQMPVFIIMFRILHGLTYEPVGGERARRPGGARRRQRHTPDRVRPALPRRPDSELYQSLVRSETMTSFGLDLSKSPAQMLGQTSPRA